jgi:hypothetical protein
MTYDKYLLGLENKTSNRLLRATLIVLLAICSSLHGAERNQREPVVVLRDKLNSDGFIGMLKAAEAENLVLPMIPSAWHMEHIMKPEARAQAGLWRALGARIVAEIEKETRFLLEAATVQATESRVTGLLDLAQWCTQSEGYGNVMLGRRCLDLASVGVAKLLVNPDFPQERCDRIMARLSNPRLDQESGRRILNQEAGAEVFPPGLPAEEMQRVWGNGRILWRVKMNPSRNLERTYPIPPETPLIMRNLAFFADPDWPASVARTAQSTWDVKWHGRIVKGLKTQNLERIEALARFRKAVGKFPDGQDSGDALRPGPEGVFYKAWLAQGDAPAGQDMAQQDQYRRVGLAAWAAYDRVRRGMFVDEDTEAKSLAK